MSNTVNKPDIISSHPLFINIAEAISHSINRILKVYIPGLCTYDTRRFYECTISIRVAQLCTYIIDIFLYMFRLPQPPPPR
jgi:hypothetical protein